MPDMVYWQTTPYFDSASQPSLLALSTPFAQPKLAYVTSDMTRSWLTPVKIYPHHRSSIRLETAAVHLQWNGANTPESIQNNFKIFFELKQDCRKW